MTRTGPRVRWVAAVMMVVGLVGCGSDPDDEWEVVDPDQVRDLALDACTREVDTLMRLRGYPERPRPETPQYGYRLIFFERCMTDRGFERD